MKFSIVTPSYNYGRFLPDAIKSVTDQQYPFKEHIVVDAESTDNTRAILEAHALLPHLDWVSEPDKGQTDAINKGFTMATGDIVAWLNADDYYLDGTLASVAEAFERYPDVDIVYGDTLFVDADKTPIRVKKDHHFDYSILLYYGCYIQSTSTFFRRRIIDDGHLLDDYFKCSMDYEYFVRLANLGYTFYYIPQVMAAFRWHEGNVSAVQTRRRREERLIVQNRYGFKIIKSQKAQVFLYDTAFRVLRGKRVLRKIFEKVVS